MGSQKVEPPSFSAQLSLLDVSPRAGSGTRQAQPGRVFANDWQSSPPEHRAGLSKQVAPASVTAPVEPLDPEPEEIDPVDPDEAPLLEVPLPFEPDALEDEALEDKVVVDELAVPLEELVCDEPLELTEPEVLLVVPLLVDVVAAEVADEPVDAAAAELEL